MNGFVTLPKTTHTHPTQTLATEGTKDFGEALTHKMRDNMHRKSLNMKKSPLWTLCALSALLLAACDDDAGSGTQPTEDTGSDTVEDTTPPTDTTPTDTNTDVDTTPDPCSQCGTGEVCVRNETVTDICFPSDCSTQTCADGEICDGDVCVVEACAGVQCDTGEICLAGTCAVGSCASGQVTCPTGEVCDPQNDACVTACTEQSTCNDLACSGGLCVPCDDTRTCGGALVCDGGQCLTACTDDPNACNSTEACDPSTGICVASCESDPSVCTNGTVCDTDTGLCATSCADDPSVCGTGEVCEATSGLCIPPCTSDSTCTANAQICDFTSGLCIAPECTVNGTQAECLSTEICLDGRCEILNPRFTGSLAGGAGSSTSTSGYQLTGVISPVEVTGSGTSLSTSYKLDAGMIMILAP